MVQAGSGSIESSHESIARMAATEKIKTKEGLEKSIQRASDSLKKFAEFRSLCDIILEILHSLINAQGGAGIEPFVNAGGLKSVLDHLRRSQYSARTQINGWQMMSDVLQNNQSYVEPLRAGGESCMVL